MSFYSSTPPNNTALLAGLHFIPGSVTPVDETYFAFCDRRGASEAGLTANGRWQLPAPLDRPLPSRQPSHGIHRQRAQPHHHRRCTDYPNLIYGFRKSRLHRSLLETPDEEIFFLFDVLRTTDPSMITQAVAQNRQFYDSARSLGGKFYPISAVGLSHADWVRQYVPDFGHLASAKAHYDPAKILTPGPGIFN